MLQGKGEFTSDRAIALMLQHAYSGTAEERTKLLNAVKDASPISQGDDAETQLERWRRTSRSNSRWLNAPSPSAEMPRYGGQIGRREGIEAGA